MNLYKHPSCLDDHIDLMMQHEICLTFDTPNGPVAYGPCRDNEHILAYEIEGLGTSIYGDSDIGDAQPFYMDWDSWIDYKTYIEELGYL